MVEAEPQHLVANEETMARATKVGPKASIADIRLVNFAARASGLTNESPTLMRTSFGHSIARENDDFVIVLVSFKIDVAYDSEESRQSPPVTIHATYAVRYRVVELSGFSDEDLDAFAQINGNFNAWPFWRELFYSTMGRMGVQPSTIPTLRVGPAKPVDKNQ